MTRYRLDFRPALLAVLACCVAMSVACTSGSGTGVTLQTPPTATSSVTSPAAPSSSAQSPTTVGSSASPDPSTSTGSVSSVTAPSSTAATPADREAADRAAVQSVWSDYWTTSERLFGLSVSQQKSALSMVAVDPALQLVLDSVAKFKKNGWVDYGSVSHRPYWSSPIAGKSIAVMGDCMDDSKYGSMDTKTGKKLTVGVPRDNTRVTAVKIAGGGWRIQKIEYLVNGPC